MGTVRKIPMRKCVGCNERKEKKDLMRVLRTPEGKIVLDISGRQNGRGAYICKSVACLKKAQKNRGLLRSLDVDIPENVYAELEKEMAEFEQ